MRLCRHSSVPVLCAPQGGGGPWPFGWPGVRSGARSFEQSGSTFAPSCSLICCPARPTACSRLESARIGVIARVSVLVCRVINRDSLPHAIVSILIAWSSRGLYALVSAQQRPCVVCPPGRGGSVAVRLARCAEWRAKLRAEWLDFRAFV